MNLTELGPGHWLPLRLPDGRIAIAEGGNPDHAAVVKAIRRINQAGMSSRGGEWPGRPEDYALVAGWLDEFEPLPDGQLFTWEGGAAA